MCLFGWITRLLLALPQQVFAPMVAFLSGAVIMNSTVTELRNEGNGKSWPFMTGGIVYGAILLPFG
jgi:hypothetical protein